LLDAYAYIAELSDRLGWSTMTAMLAPWGSCHHALCWPFSSSAQRYCIYRGGDELNGQHKREDERVWRYDADGGAAEGRDEQRVTGATDKRPGDGTSAPGARRARRRDVTARGHERRARAHRAPMSAGRAPMSAGRAPMSAGRAPMSAGRAPMSAGRAPPRGPKGGGPRGREARGAWGKLFDQPMGEAIVVSRSYTVRPRPSSPPLNSGARHYLLARAQTRRRPSGAANRGPRAVV